MTRDPQKEATLIARSQGKVELLHFLSDPDYLRTELGVLTGETRRSAARSYAPKAPMSGLQQHLMIQQQARSMVASKLEEE